MKSSWLAVLLLAASSAASPLLQGLLPRQTTTLNFKKCAGEGANTVDCTGGTFSKCLVQSGPYTKICVRAPQFASRDSLLTRAADLPGVHWQLYRW
jgi:hypothetical protein